MTPDYDAVTSYLAEVQAQYESGHAREHAYRPALERLMNSFEDCLAVNDPRRSEHGNPDMIFLRRSHRAIILGYAEAKDIGVSLDQAEKSDQMSRYGGYANLFLTDYLEFRFFKNGEKYQKITLGKIKDGTIEVNPTARRELADEIAAFLSLPPEKIRSGRRLAQLMGAKSRRIRDNVSHYLEKTDEERNGELETIFSLMRRLLVHDLSTETFADMYAQTLVYGLFVARYSDTTPHDFTRQEARDLVPKSNPFLRKFFDHIAGADFDTRLTYIVDELCEVFQVSDVKDIVHKHLRVATGNTEKDPIIHFYEDFLKEYDPAERKRMGAYYTPVPVVQFIIRQVDASLKRDFGLSRGLADTSQITRTVDLGQEIEVMKTQSTGRRIKSKASTVERKFHRVQVLDPAVGTATFLNETIKFIYNGFKGQEGRWPSYVRDDLVDRLSGFELMMAPYTIAHLKLGITLSETGVEDIGKRLGVYLTNTLEEGVPRQPDLFSFGLAQAVSDESEAASEIKHQRPIMVIMGNPPYSGISSNETQFANQLVTKYKVEPGGTIKLQERKHWLNDDYVKFIAFAEDMIGKNGEGVLAMITNHGYLDNPSFRGMRWHLAKTFDNIRVVDLHGNLKKRETAPDGSKDQNVFDIQPGVAIILATKTGQKNRGQLANVQHSEAYGTRAEKFTRLSNDDLAWQNLALDKNMVYFKPQNTFGQSAYDEGVNLDDLFIVTNTGIVTMGDKFIIADSKQKITERVEKLISGGYTEQELKGDFQLGKNYAAWAIGNCEAIQFDEAKIVPLAYRPFDTRYTYLDNKLVWRPRTNVMHNYVEGENVGLLFSRMTKGRPFAHAFITNTISEVIFLSPLSGTNAFNAPLYQYHDDGTRTPNFKPDVLKKLTVKLEQAYGPFEIMDYVYAVLYSPMYRRTYQAFLANDFPKIPIPESDAEFKRMSMLGHELRDLHLMKSPALDQFGTTFPETSTDEVDRAEWVADSNDDEKGKVFINDAQYFGAVPKVAWDFCIGGNQPAQKWLKDRKGQRLSNSEIEHYQRVIQALVGTHTIMLRIDQTVGFAAGA